MSKALFSGHIDFALSENEINVCFVCRRAPRDPQSQHHSRWWRYVSVTPAGRYPIRGLVAYAAAMRKNPEKRTSLPTGGNKPLSLFASSKTYRSNLSPGAIATTRLWHRPFEMLLLGCLCLRVTRSWITCFQHPTLALPARECVSRR